MKTQLDVLHELRITPEEYEVVKRIFLNYRERDVKFFKMRYDKNMSYLEIKRNGFEDFTACEIGAAISKLEFAMRSFIDGYRVGKEDASA